MSADHKPIFITGRFRSGTSFLWQIFEQLEGYCAWYEPLHPQLLTAIQFTQPKADHVGVGDYWSTYRKHPRFADKYSMDFATKHLYLERRDDYPELAAYIKHLMLLSGGDTPVLQFNRVDFRLGWLKDRFPEATIIHIDRNPWQLYRSQRQHINADHRHQADYWDAYELVPWCHALAPIFPFLCSEEFAQHAFLRCYAIQRLAGWVAQGHADINIRLDEDVFESDDFLSLLQSVLPLSQEQLARIKSLRHRRWSAPVIETEADQLVGMMQQVEQHLVAAGLADNLGQRALSAIKFHHPAYWSQWRDVRPSLSQLQRQASELSKEVTRIDQENQYYLREIDTWSAGQESLDDMPQTVMDVSAIQVPDSKRVDDWLLCCHALSNAMTQVLAINDHLNPIFYALKARVEAQATDDQPDPQTP